MLNCSLNILSLSRLREISDIAKRQVEFLNTQQQSREKEVESLRMQLLDYQVHIVLPPLFSLLAKLTSDSDGAWRAKQD